VRKMRNKNGKKMRGYILLVLVIGGVIAVFFGILTMSSNEGGSATIDSAEQLRINASEIGMGVEEIKSSYISDPVDFYKRGGNRTNQSFVFELGSKLEECSAIDLIRLQLYAKPKEPMLLAGYAADFYVFNDTTGAKEFFDYIKKAMNGTSVSELGDEAAYSEQMSGWLVRTSNAVLLVGFVGVRGEFDGKDASRIIAEKIVEKVSHK